MPTTEPVRDVLSPREVADRAGFSYHAILRAIRRGDLEAFEPVPGHYRIEVAEYERWLRRPAQPRKPPPPPAPRRERPRPRPAIDPSHPGSFARLPRNRRELSTVDIYRKPNGKWQVRWREGDDPPLRPDVRPQGRRPELHGLAAAPPAARPGRGPR